MAGHDWENFYRITQDSPPWELMERAAAIAPGKRALDLGAGAGRDTRSLLAQGFTVTAVDAEAAAVARLAALAPADAPERLRAVQSTFQDFVFDGAPYDLISAQFSLPFTPSDQFTGVFTRIKEALAPGGVFAGQFFGDHDQWNTPGSGMTFVTRAQAEALLSDLEVVEFRDLEEDSSTADGTPKHWHVFHILARKPASG